MSYFIIGGDGKQYGPITAEQVRGWFAQQRLNGQSQVRPENVPEWRTLRTLPEFADLFTPPQMAGAPATPGWSAPPPASGLPRTPAELEARATQGCPVDIGTCISRAWSLVMANFGMVIGAALIILILQMAINLLPKAMSAVIGVLLGSVFNGGLFYFFLRVVRGEPPAFEDVFAGFRLAFVQLVLGGLVTTLLTVAVVAVSALPAIGVGLAIGFNLTNPEPAQVVMLIGIVVVCCIVPVTYLSVAWVFSMPLIIDQQIGFWEAMNVSRRSVHPRWWSVFGLLLVCGLVVLAGVLCCCVGFLVSWPISVAALAYAYEDLYGNIAAPPESDLTPTQTIT